MDTPGFEKPLPEPSAETRPHWDGLKEHRLMLQRCAQCKKARHYPRPMCDQCYCLESEWFEASGKGSVHSWTVAHHPFHMGFKQDLPYVVLTIDLEEGVRMVAPLANAGAAELSLGCPVTIGYEDVNEELTLPRFSIDG